MADARPDVALQRKLRPLRRSPAVGDPEAAGAGAGGSSSSSTSSKKTKGPAARAGKPSFSSVLALCDPVDTLLLFVGCVGAAANGAALPLFSLAFGSMVDVLGPAATVGALRSEVERVAGYFLILAAGALVASYVEVAACTAGGARLARRLRLAYVRSALRQEVSFHDAGGDAEEGEGEEVKDGEKKKTSSSSTRGPGALLAALSSDADAVQTALSDKLGNAIHHGATFVAGMAVAFARGWSMALLMLATLPLVAAAGGAVAATLARLSAQSDAAYARAGVIATEALGNARAVAAAGAASQVAKSYSRALALPERAGAKASVLQGAVFGLANAVFLWTYALALWFGWMRVRAGEYTGGQVMSVLFAAQLGGVSLGHLLPNLEHFSRARDAGGRLLAVIRRAPRITVPSTPQRKRFSLFGGGGGGNGGSSSSSSSSSNSAGSTPRSARSPSSPFSSSLAPPTSPGVAPGVLTPVEEAAAEKKRRRLSRWAPPPKAAAALGVKGKIEFRKVSFAYEARPETLALNGLDLEILPGKTTALCGSSGSGKSTALALMLRLYDPISGSVTLDGTDLRQLDPRAFRAATALVPQEPTLFSCSVSDNIRFGKPTATDEEVRAAAVAAGASAFIDALPQGFATLVGERGGQLSGGQRQRIAIARAIVRDPKILFLDEATAALDTASQRVVQDSLARLRGKDGGGGGSKKVNAGSSSSSSVFGGLTTVIVAHRLSAIADSDRIVVMANGKNVEHGTHAELLEREGAYSALVKLQLEAGEGNGNCKGKSGVSAASGSASASASPVASPVSSPAGVAVVASSSSAAAAVEESTADAASSATSVASASAASVASASAAAKAAEASDAAPEHSLGWRRLWSLSKNDWPSILVGVLGSAALGFQMPGFALTLAPMIAVFYAPREEATRDVAKWSLVFFGIGLGCFLAATVRQTGLGRAGSRLTRRLREELLESALKQEIAWFDAPENASGALAARLSADAAHVRGAAGDALGVVVQAATGMGGGLVIAFVSGWRLALVILAAVPLLVASAWIQGAFLAGNLSKGTGTGGAGEEGSSGEKKKKKKKESSEPKKLDKDGKPLPETPPTPPRDDASLAQQVASEALAAPRVVTALGLDVPLAGAYDALLARPAKRAAARGQVTGVFFGLSQFVLFAVYALAFYYGGRLVSEGKISFEAMLRVFFAIMLSAIGFSQTQMAFPDLSKARGASRRVAALLDRVPAVDGDAPGIELGPRKVVLEEQQQEQEQEQEQESKSNSNSSRDLDVVAVSSSPSAVVPEISNAEAAATSTSSSSSSQIVPCLGRVDFSSVKFAYPSRRGAPVLTDFTLRVPAGQMVALVGPSGGGKSTVLSLLLRFYDVDAGSVELDGRDVRSLTLASLRSRVALVAQEPVMFTGTIRDNVVYGLEGFGGANVEEEGKEKEKGEKKKRGGFLFSRKGGKENNNKDNDEEAAVVLSSLKKKMTNSSSSTPAKITDAMLRAALVAANAAEFVDAAPRGIDTRLGQGDGGVQLSGGQKQRIAIARALLRDPAVLLLDEATSALDAASEAAVVAALEKASEGRTTLVVAHRLSTVANASSLAHVSGGRITEQGTHQELLAAGGAYAALVAMSSSLGLSGGDGGGGSE